jgi:hypothetical protein
MKRAWFLVLSFLIVATGFSCRNISTAKSEVKNETVMDEQDQSVIFLEVRRLNRDLPLKEFKIISDFDETVKLYGELSDKKFARSEPIPTLSDNEFFLLLKPKLKKQQYGGIEVIKIERKETVLNVYYKEVKNEEYSLNKENNPILILRVNGVIPQDVKLLLQKN